MGQHLVARTPSVASSCSLSEPSGRRGTYVWFICAVLLIGLGCNDPGDSGGAGEASEIAVTQHALGNKPHASCISAFHDDHGYWFCPTNATWSAAKAACEATGVDTKLVSIDNAAENTFVANNIGLDSLIGAADQTTEGTWRWDNGNIQFWSGTSGGSAVGGHYANWDLFFGQPDNGGFFGNEDCGLISAWSGLWFDVSCTTGYWYVCEEDLCPSDPIKESPGQCGCGTPDTDTDSDGTADCNDACPSDPNRSALPCSPDTSCTFTTFGGSQYFFCNNVRDYATAKSNCQAVDMQLARIDGADENAWIDEQIATDRWIGGTDAASEGVWLWEAGGDQFWQGNAGGSAVSGAYTNWAAGQPNNFGFGQHCLTILGNGQWDDEGCSEVEQYICEDACPFTDKAAPGQCGCDTPDTDTDSDGTADCIDVCPDDPNKDSENQCGCNVLDTDSDNDGTADCADECPSDPNNIVPGNCGCVGETSLKSANTPCYDGFCEANGLCDGSGRCGSADECLPTVGDCTTYVSPKGRLYAVCDDALTWEAARTACNTQPDMDLVRINNEAENSFLAGIVPDSYWIGAHDTISEGTWRWIDNDEALWVGDETGSPREYVSWQPGQPSASPAARDCATTNSNGLWSAENCDSTHGYVCEVQERKRFAAPGTIINVLEGIESSQQPATAYALFVALKSMCNVWRSVVVSDLEQRFDDMLNEMLTSTERDLAMDILGETCANLPAETIRADYLDGLAFADPLNTEVLSNSESVSSCDAAHVLNIQPSRLRSQFCAAGVPSDERAVSVPSLLVDRVIPPDSIDPSFERHTSGAAPVVIGLDETDGFSQFGDIASDRSNNRTPNGPPGDGFNMYGVRTDIPCSTGTCDDALGHLCSSEAPGHTAVDEEDPNCDPGPFGNPCPPISVHHCIAYPIVQFNDNIRLIGYNFWDPCSAKLVASEVGGMTERTLSLATTRIATAGEPTNNDTLACSPSPDGLRLSAVGIDASSTATFVTDGQSLPRNRFYTLQMFNMNGTFSTQHDIQERSLPSVTLDELTPRTLHVCWNCDPEVPDTNCPATCDDPTDTYCTLSRCDEPIAETCEDDGCAGSVVSECDPPGGPRNGECLIDIWPAEPRSLSNPLCQHAPGEEPRCAETPMWFGSTPHPTFGNPIIFLAESAPDYRVTLTVERIRCQQETGWSDCFFCNDDEMVAKLATVVRNANRTPVTTEPWDYNAEFDEGQVRNPNAVASRIKIRRNEVPQWELVYTEEDNFALESILSTALLTIAGAYVAGPYGAAVGGGIGTIPIFYSDFIEGVDIMGTDAWTADIVRLLKAHGDSRTPDLLLTPPFLARFPIESIPHQDSSKSERKWHSACDRLMHPFDTSYRNVLVPTYDITRNNSVGSILDCDGYYAAVRQCGPSFVGSPDCSAPECFAGRCTDDPVGLDGCHPDDQFCGAGTGEDRIKGFYERRDIASDAEAGEARYVWDIRYTIETCDPTVEPGNTSVCQEPP